MDASVEAALREDLLVRLVTSIKILSQRATSDRCSAAVAVDDSDGKGYIVIGVFAKDGDELYPKGGCEGPDRDVAGRQGPYLGLYAYADGHFFAGGRLQSAGLAIARVRLIWEDGDELQDTVENGIVMFLGARESIEDPATLEFLDEDGRVVGHQIVAVHQGRGSDERKHRGACVGGRALRGVKAEACTGGLACRRACGSS